MNNSTITLETRHSYLLDAAKYLREGKEIPDLLLSKLGLSPRKNAVDSPDLDSFLDAMSEYHKYMLEYRMLIDEIRLSCGIATS